MGKESAVVNFVEVGADAESVAPMATPSTFEVVLPSGITVRVPSRFDATALRRLVDLMTAR